MSEQKFLDKIGLSTFLKKLKTIFAPKIHSHTKSEIGLSNVNNTADSEKSVKYATSAGTATSATKLSSKNTENGYDATVTAGAFPNGANVQISVTESAGSNTVIISGSEVSFQSQIKTQGLVYAANGFYRNGVTEILYNKLLWSGERYPTASQTSNFQEPVSSQPHGILLVFSGYDMGSAKDVDWNTFFVSKREIAEWPGRGHGFLMSSTNLNRVCQKYIYISDTFLKGHDQNNQSGTGDSGTSYKNHLFVLRYVFGV